MKVILAKYGGFAAGIFRPPSIVESSTLPTADAMELSRLVVALKTASDSQGSEPGQARDAMSYTITVEETSGETTVITQSDTNMSPAFVNLMQWIDRH
jgi:N-acyl-L-homoserine lactone synthetase